MDGKLRFTLNQAIDGAITAALKRKGSLLAPVPRAKTAMKRERNRHEKRTKTVSIQSGTGPLFRSVYYRLTKQSLWKKIQTQIVIDGLADLINLKVSAYYREQARYAQFSLPGFDHLPETIQVDRRALSLGLVKVSEFLGYEARYNARSQRNQGRADELHRLAEKLRPLADSDLTVSEACFPGADVVVMTGKAAR
jgi:hypothetical protein